MTTKTKRKPIATIMLEANGSTRRVSGEYPPPRPEKVQATPEMRAELRRRYEEEAIAREELETVLRIESHRLCVTRTVEEYERVETTRTKKIKQFTERTDKLVLRTDNHTREVRKVATTIAKLEKGNRLSRDLAIVLHQFARRVADGHGAATLDGDDSTSRLTSQYEPIGTKSGFGSRTPSDAQMDGLRCLQEMKKLVPKQLKRIFDQIVNEETSGWHDRPRTLSEIGQEIGYQDSQASAAGGALVHAVCCLIDHFMRENGYVAYSKRETVALEQQR